MKSFILKSVTFVQNINILYRIAFTVVLFFLFQMFYSDLKFNIEIKKPKQYTVDQLKTNNLDTLPKYIILTDAQLMRADNTESIDSNMDISNVSIQSYNYVVQQRIKKGDTSISNITYPIYSKTQIKENPNAKSIDVQSHIVIQDSKVKEEDLVDDKYFNDPKFAVMGQFDGKTIDSETYTLLNESGYNISKNAIILSRGDTPMSLLNSLILTILSSLLLIILILTFIPNSILYKMMGIEPEYTKIKE